MLLRLLLILLLAILPARACLWDRDTLAEEAKGKLDTVKAIVGWFDRYPPKYYEMRLERVTRGLAADPNCLDLYDDAGVACSRLGRHDEAIAWMTKKKAVLDTLPEAETAESRYRYLSNIGTFHLIRWIVKPQAERNADLSDLKASGDFIARALRLNPDAHFGREKFQLMLIRWLLNPALNPKDHGSHNFLGVEMYSGGGSGDPDGAFTFAEASRGITGLIQLGAAWQSVDTALALQMSLSGEDTNYVAQLAWQRRQELLAAGETSLHPSSLVRDRVATVPDAGDVYGKDKIAAFYKEARSAAGSREAAWLAYQEARFAQGMHPDTHPDFWKDWKEPTFPKFPGQTFDRPESKVILFLGAVVALIGGAIVLWMISFIKRRRKRATRVA